MRKHATRGALAIAGVLLAAMLAVSCESTSDTGETEEPETVTLTFDANATDVSGMPEAVSVLPGSKAAEPPAPAREGYLFGGWFADDACSTGFRFTTALTEDRTVYAMWIEANPAYPAGVSAVSGMPEPNAGGVDAPTVPTPGNLEILPWAGFAGATTFTFDDGQPSQVAHYAELNALGVPLTFYITSDWANTSADFVSTWSQAALDGHELGNHTTTHHKADGSQSGTGTPAAADPLDEIDQCTAYIEGTLGGAVTSFAAPYGDSAWAQYAGQRFMLNRGVGGGTVAFTGSTDPLNLPVKMAGGNERFADFKKGIENADAQGTWLIHLFHAILPGANWYAGVAMDTISQTATYAKGQDLWIDTVSAVGSYWVGAKTLAAVTPTTGADGALTWTWTLPDHFPTGRYLRITVDGSSVTQNGSAVPWDDCGYYEISLDEGELTVSP